MPIREDARRRIEAARGRLDALRPLSAEVIAALRHADDVALTYTSNAIEGNTLTHLETALVIEKGITIGGKTVTEHLEAQDHYAALQLMHQMARGSSPIAEGDVRELHRRIVMRSRPQIAGVYSTMPRRTAGSAVVFPNAARIPELMSELGSWLAGQPASAEVAFEAHLRLVSIHPFADGNGRTARMLMNLILIRAGYPPIPIRPEDRKRYLESLESCQTGGETMPYFDLLSELLEVTLEHYLARCEEAAPGQGSGQ